MRFFVIWTRNRYEDDHELLPSQKSPDVDPVRVSYGGNPTN